MEQARTHCRSSSCRSSLRRKWPPLMQFCSLRKAPSSSRSSRCRWNRAKKRGKGTKGRGSWKESREESATGVLEAQSAKVLSTRDARQGKNERHTQLTFTNIFIVATGEFSLRSVLRSPYFRMTTTAIQMASTSAMLPNCSRFLLGHGLHVLPTLRPNPCAQTPHLMPEKPIRVECKSRASERGIRAQPPPRHAAA